MDIFNNYLNWILSVVITVAAALISITFHEVSHGFAAYKMGDDTAKIYGRLSLNPFKHLDIIGTICLVLFRFGWAKPVPVNQYNFKDRKKGIILVSLAGPFSNLLLAFVAQFCMTLIEKFGGISDLDWYLYYFFRALTVTNLGLCVFNLIPIPPLDGSRVLGEFLSEGQRYRFESISKYSSFILLALLWLPRISTLFSSLLNVVVSAIYTGYQTVINLILGVF